MEKINLEDIKGIPSDEFRKQISNWIEGKGFSKQLQSQLRKDLIENFNKTTLGRQIATEFQSEHRMTLSPLILALNSLVAEFLYAQNCHYSLSVFSTEVPYKNTMPDFEKRERFRFNKAELFEIFDAMGIKTDSEVSGQIFALYSSNQTTGTKSLLFCMIKMLLKTVNGNHIPQLIGEDSTKLDTKNIKYLNKYLNSLTKKIKQMSHGITKVSVRNGLNSKSDINESRVQKEEGIERLEIINKSLERITDDVKLIDRSNKHGRQISDIVKSIDKLTECFESCSLNIGLLIKKYEHSLNPEVSKTVPEKQLTYPEWLNEMTNSTYGRKFLKKLETSMAKSIEHQNQELEIAFKENLDKEKRLIKMHYRQKYIEQTFQIHDEPKETQRLPSTKLIDEKSQHLDNQEVELTKKFISDNKYEGAIPITISNLSKHSVVDINIKPELPMIGDTANNTETHIIEGNSKHIDRIVMEAKERLLRLERESEQLDHSFQNYLQRQNSEKSKIKRDVNKIWESYEFGREILSKKIVNSNPKKNFVINITENADDMMRNTDRQYQENNVMGLVEGITKNMDISFENPFKNFDPEVYLLKAKQERTKRYSLPEKNDFNDNRIEKYLTITESIKIDPELKTTDRKNHHFLEMADTIVQNKIPVDGVISTEIENRNKSLEMKQQINVIMPKDYIHDEIRNKSPAIQQQINVISPKENFDIDTIKVSPEIQPQINVILTQDNSDDEIRKRSPEIQKQLSVVLPQDSTDDDDNIIISTGTQSNSVSDDFWK